MTHSPRLSTPLVVRDTLPEPATEAEVDALVDLAHRLGVRSVVIGHGRDDVSRQNAARFAARWEAGDGEVLVRVSWPEEAASWLRQARRLTSPEPDLWVLGGAAAGLAQVTRRLAWSTLWRPRRTLALGSSTVRETLRLAGARVLAGMRGAHPDGALWQIRDDDMGYLHPAEIERSSR